MTALPTDWLALLLAVFVLGARHGLDADHIAAIDGVARFNAAQRPRLARGCGAWFSLGHGGIVVAIAMVVALAAPAWTVPEETEQVGTWISILFLALLGAMNIAAVFATPPHAVVQPAGLRGRLFARLSHAGSPWLVALVGALFAISFDTLSQAALFALAGTQFGGARHALALAVTFAAGMLLVDGANGLWFTQILRRTDRTARIASRVTGLGVGVLSLALAACGALR